MNRENIQKVRDHIAALPPERFNMEYWTLDTNGGGIEALQDCETAACIGGWTNFVLKTDYGSRAAAEAMGLNADLAEALFYPSADDQDPVWGATPSQAGRVLDLLLETGEVDWKRAISEAGA